MARQPPTLVFAVIGQAKIAGLISPEAESSVLSALLKAWAVRGGFDVVQRSHSNQAASVRRASSQSKGHDRQVSWTPETGATARRPC